MKKANGHWGFLTISRDGDCSRTCSYRTITKSNFKCDKQEQVKSCVAADKGLGTCEIVENNILVFVYGFR